MIDNFNFKVFSQVSICTSHDSNYYFIQAIIASKSNIVQMSNGVVNRFFQTTTDSNNINWKHCHFDQIVADIKTQCIIPGSGVKFDLSEELKKSNLAYAKYAKFFDKIGTRLVRM